MSFRKTALLASALAAFCAPALAAPCQFEVDRNMVDWSMRVLGESLSVHPDLGTHSLVENRRHFTPDAYKILAGDLKRSQVARDATSRNTAVIMALSDPAVMSAVAEGETRKITVAAKAERTWQTRWFNSNQPTGAETLTVLYEYVQASPLSLPKISFARVLHGGDVAPPQASERCAGWIGKAASPTFGGIAGTVEDSAVASHMTVNGGGN